MKLQLNGSNNGGQSSNNKPGVNSKPDKDNGKLPSTGGRAALPIVVAGIVMVAGGIYISSKRK
ncbi:LPXTG cell wall anchor domain-containing protein [uncultured Clostridium sp.]|uniref:LPXTG cell wall anchor domain-containing protein n=1 Tax=Clostridium TaxID=1485 RepID=UPI001C8C2D76|nr:LPXTG cell wall anchor domain-containing protein [Clostridium sp. K12(2020)]MBX9144936.1 LPXTG cell wall anchor domain-containing protein [Clostridium sp. K13]